VITRASPVRDDTAAIDAGLLAGPVVTAGDARPLQASPASPGLTSIAGIRGFSGECAFAALPSEAFAHTPRKSMGKSAFAS
jgi:hypothetical protein